MCLYYHKIDLNQLSTSNPYSEEYPSPVELALPNNIIVETPESQRYSAWSNLRRFPSLNSHPAPDRTDSLSAAQGGITVLGPRELAKQQYIPYRPYRAQQQHAANQASKPPRASSDASIRKLHHHSRVNSLQSIYSPDYDHSVEPSTSKSVGPVSEDEFSYLSSSPGQSVDKRFRTFSEGTATIVPDAVVSFPPPLRNRHAEQSSRKWIDQLCQNL